MGRSETRPYVVCHMLASLDGRIEGGFFAEPKCSAAQKEYASLRSFFCCEATLYGTTTALEFAGGEAGQLPRPKQLLPYADYRAPAKEHDYLVAVDARGRIGWQSGTFARPGRPEAHIIELLTEQTAPEYLEYLRERGISYIVAGRNLVDFKSALRRLNELFGVKRVMLAGGGLINGSDGSGVYADNPSQSGASGSVGPARSGAVQGKAAVPEGADRESAPVDGGVAEVRRSAAVGDGQTSFVRVTAKVKDAELQAELIRLNDELAALKAKVAGIEAERSAALAELDLVRSGLGELLEKLHDKDQQLSALQLKFAGMLDAGGRSESGEREVQLMGRYKALVDQGGALALRFTEFCKKVDSLASAMDLDEVQRAELRLTMENLSGELQKFSVALDSGSEEASFRNTRILAINRDLGLVVLPVGINHGVFNGLMMYPVGDPSTALRIISVRPNVSGAIVVSGEISRLSSGQEVRADREKTE